MPWKVTKPFKKPLIQTITTRAIFVRDWTKCPHESVRLSGEAWRCNGCESEVKPVHEIKQATFVFDGDDAAPRFEA